MMWCRVSRGRGHDRVARPRWTLAWPRSRLGSRREKIPIKLKMADRGHALHVAVATVREI